MKMLHSSELPSAGAGAPNSGTRRRKLLWAALSVVVALGAISFVVARMGLPGSLAQLGSGSRLRASTAPDPAPSWQFDALRATAIHVLLTMSNRHTFPVDIQVHVGHHIRRVHIPAEGQAQLEVSAQDAARALTVVPKTVVLERFAVLPVVTRQVLLDVTNRNHFPVNVRLRTVQRVLTVRISGDSVTEMGLTGREAAEPVSITASDAILPARLVTGPHGVQVTYATPGPALAAPPRPAVTSAPRSPSPSRSWQFAPLTRVTGGVLLTMSNANSYLVTARIRVGQHVRVVRVPARSGIELDVTKREATQALTLTASGPIVPARLVVTRHGVEASYGSPGSGK